jgi:hypothetical protein
MKLFTKNIRYIDLQQIHDNRDGIINIAEASNQIPFNIKRVYSITGLKKNSDSRGHHAHKELQQAIFCISGSFKLIVNDGMNEEEVILNTPQKGVYLGEELWHAMSDFSANCIILVLSSDLYKETDYIRDFDEFKTHIKKID